MDSDAVTKHKKNPCLTAMTRAAQASLVALLLGTPASAITEDQEGTLKVAGVCAALADAVNSYLSRTGEPQSWAWLKTVSDETHEELRDQPGASEIFFGMYGATSEGLRDYSDVALAAFAAGVMPECVTTLCQGNRNCPRQ